METKEQLLLAITEIFMRYGIKSLTMDDISSHLGISKKTLYQHVSDKKDLVKQCVELTVGAEQCMLCEISEEKGNAIDELFFVNKRISEKLQHIQPAVMFDLQKYYPEAWKVMENHKQCFIYDMMVKNIHDGIAQGLYRDNVTPEIVAKIYVSMIDKMFDPDFFPAKQFTFETLHREIARYHIRGIASEKGVKYFSQKIINENLNF
ncbi:MAG: TetR/AcrR family transcriptional regulator [Bacteroidetes bacterium]|nr:TetR/AcrR family transcriptional regulator [Bacteroidota bacterium]